MPEQPRYPIEYPKTDVVFGQYDASGVFLRSGALSLTEIEVLDLISEGEIAGLVTGDYPLTGVSGNAGEIGWQTYNFVPYQIPPNTTNARQLRSIFWNKVPVVSSDNKYNFQRIDTSFTLGTPDGSFVNQSNSELTITRSIGERLRGTSNVLDGDTTDINKDYIKYYRILNKECQAAIINIRFNSLSETINVPNYKGQEGAFGDTIPTNVEYKIEYRPLFSTINKTPSYYFLGKKENIRGKLTYGYIKASRVNFFGNFPKEKDFLGWELKITRLTEDSLKTNIRNQTFIDSITEVYSNTFLYPDSAIVRSKFSAEFFSQVPERAFDVKLLKVKVPDTYNPETKRYTESAEGWSGFFHPDKLWTDNPAWCYYDLLTNPRYGLGKYLPEANIDKWTLYQIGKYCDTLVADGYGTLEPRFTCNLILNTREEAYKVINDMASIFRGITYYGGGTIYAVQDSPKEPVYQFTNENVIDGNFTYSSSSKRVRNTVAIVRYNDKNNFYKPSVEYVEDFDGIRQYGIRETEVAAFGCTSRGQARRLGKWMLLSEKTETETISFGAGIEGSFLRPGDIIQVFDANRKLTQYAGRTISIKHETNPKVLLDRNVSFNSNSVYQFNILSPSYYYDPGQVTDISGGDYLNIRRPQLQNLYFTGFQASGVTGDGTVRTEITFDNKTFNTTDYIVTGNLIWSISLYSGHLKGVTGTTTITESYSHLDSNYDYYRVIKNQEEDYKYNIIALSHNILKYNDLESGLYFETPKQDYQVLPEPPVSMSLSINRLSRNSRSISYAFAPANYSGITSYRVYASLNSGAILSAQVPDKQYIIGNLPSDVLDGSLNVYTTGSYYFRVHSVNDASNKISTGYTTGVATVTSSYPIRDVIISSLTFLDDNISNASGIRRTGEYDFESPTFKWQVGVDPGSNLPFDWNYRVTIRQPSTSNTPSSTVYYQTTGYSAKVDRPFYTFDFGTNINLSGGPYREYDIVVEAIDASGRTSAGNQVTGPTSWTENGWSTNAQGYDIFYVNNKRITGIYLTTGGISPNNLKTEQWIDTDGSIKVLITSGNLPSKAKGGYIYANSGIFNSGEILSGIISIIEMDPFNVNSNFLSASSRINYTNSGWMTIALYDAYDAALRNKGMSIEYTLPYANIVPVYGSGDIYSLRATREISIYNTNNLSDYNSVQMGRITEGGKTYAVSKFIDNNGIEFIGASRLL